MLTPEQQKYFEDSKIRDDNGQLVVCMHRTNHEFDAFDKDKITDDSYCGRGFYFTSRTDFGKSFGGKTLECYLNITKPLILTDMDADAKWALLYHFANSEEYQQGDLPRIAGYPQKSEKRDAETLRDIIEYHPWSAEVQSMIDDLKLSTRYEWFAESDNIDELNDGGILDELIRNEEFMDVVREYYIEDYIQMESLTENDLNYTRFHYGAWNDFAGLLTEYAQQNGYDGILLDLHQGRSTEIVVFEHNQIKLTTNLHPTHSDLLYEEAPVEERASLDSLIAAAGEATPGNSDIQSRDREDDAR